MDRILLLVAMMLAGVASFILAWATMGFIMLEWDVSYWEPSHRLLVALATLVGPLYIWWTANEK